MSARGTMVLVVGATGRIANLVLPELVRRGARVRALIRHDSDAADARRRGAEQIAVGDLRDVASLQAAARDIDGVFHIGPAFVPDEAQLGINMVDAAVRAGVRRFAFSGVIHPGNGLANHASKQPVEQALFASSLQYTILQPATLFQNIAGARDTVVHEGVFGEPFSRTARVARVDYRDVAEVAAIALTEDRLAYGTYELCADGQPDREDIVAAMSDVLRRPVAAAEPTFDAWAKAADLPYDEHALELLAAVYASYSAHGLPGNSLILRTILGREPRTLRDYLQDLLTDAHTPDADRAARRSRVLSIPASEVCDD